MIYRLISVVLITLFSTNIVMGNRLVDNDSLSLTSTQSFDKIKQIDTLKTLKPSVNDIAFDVYCSKPFKMLCAGVPLIVSGLIIKGEDNTFRSLRIDNASKYDTRIDDYLQYSPAAVMLGLKVAGVKGRSSWGRMLVSDAFTVALMASTVNLIKRTSKTMRPDGSNNHSFPSGHTATAFMCATMLHKEYGGVSPWYSVGAYSIATFTGVSRILNNKHWLSDVLVGAGIGILSTELGYFLADLIFKDKGISDFGPELPYDKYHNPSFLGAYLGFNLAVNDYNMPNNNIHFGTGANAGVEGAYFFSPYVGIGGKLNLSNMPVTLNGVAESNMFNMLSTHIGAYFSYPINPWFRAGCKTLFGYTDFLKCNLSTITIGGRGGLGVGTGLSLSYVSSKNFSVKAFADYNITTSAVKYSQNSMQYITLGSVVAINF